MNKSLDYQLVGSYYRYMNSANKTAEQMLDCAQGVMVEMGDSGFGYADVGDSALFGTIARNALACYQPTQTK